MPIIIDNIDQRSPEWFKLRAGVITASNFDKIITPTGKPSSSVYAYQVAGEALLGHPEDDPFTTPWMDRGQELEEEARKFYQIVTGQEVKTVGFVFKDESRRVGCSPDGLIGDDGGLEIKCLKLSNHMQVLEKRAIPTKYIPQVQGSLWVTERKWWDFMCYYPGLEPVIIRVWPDEEYQKQLEKELNKAITKINSILEGVHKNDMTVCEFCKDGICTASVCYSSTRCGCRDKDGNPNYE